MRTIIGRVEHYDLIRCIGRGGMGVVFEAFDTDLQRAVALKMMSPALLVDSTNSERFLREARSAAAISHPAVIAIYGVSKVRDLPYLVMELFEGESLQTRLEREKKLDVESAIEIATQVVEGLAAAHATGVIHRDIKPANILIRREDNSVKLTDFGLAFTLSENRLTQTGTLLGTPEYLAPEQIHGDRIDQRSDLFSLGSVIYHMCVGQPPFVTSSLVTTLREVASTKPLSLHLVNHDVPIWLSELVEKMHAKDPAQRMPDANSVIAALQTRKRPLLSFAKQSRKESTSWSMPRVAILAIMFAASIFLAGLVLLPDVEERLVAETSAQLIEYLENSIEEDLVVELVSSEPYVLPPLEFEHRSVQIVAVDDAEPVIIFRLDSYDSAIRCEDTRLEISGVQMEILNAESDLEEYEEESDTDAEAAIVCASGSLELDDCQLNSAERHGLVLFESNCKLTETTLRSGDVAIVCEPHETAQLTLDSSTIIAESGIGFHGTAQGTVHVTESVFETNYAFQFYYDYDSMEKVTVFAEGSHFECEEALFGVYVVDTWDLEEIQEDLDSLVPYAWVGSENELPEVALIVLSEDGEEEIIVDIEEW